MDNYASQGFMKTVSGEWVNLFNPDPDTLILDDMVTAASRIIRFNGHSTITLLDHLCRVHDIVKHYHHITLLGEVQRAALMHDVHEPYVTDLPSPMKAALRKGWPTSDYDDIEAVFMERVAAKFNFPYPHPPIVKQADMLALLVEANMTWGAGTGESWGLSAPDDFDQAQFMVNDNDFGRRYRDTFTLEAEGFRFIDLTLENHA